MASTTAKAIATARELADLFAKEVISTLPIQVQSVDSVGNPVLTLSADATPATTEKVIVIRVRPLAAWTPKDSLGLDSQMYTPHQIDICTEINAAGAPNILTPVELAPVLCEIAKRGMIVNWYQSPAGDVPALSEMTDAQLTKSFQDLYWSASKAQ